MAAAVPVAAAGAASWLGPLIGVGGSLLGGLLGLKGSKDASKAQAKANSDALAFARQQEANRRQEWEYQQRAAAAAWQARQAMVMPFLAGGLGVLAKYGIKSSMPQMTSMPPLPGGGMMPPMSGMPSRGVTTGLVGRPMSLGDTLGGYRG